MTLYYQSSNSLEDIENRDEYDEYESDKKVTVVTFRKWLR
jgi:hypothetical protein